MEISTTLPRKAIETIYFSGQQETTASKASIKVSRPMKEDEFVNQIRHLNFSMQSC